MDGICLRLRGLGPAGDGRGEVGVSCPCRRRLAFALRARCSGAPPQTRLEIGLQALRPAPGLGPLAALGTATQGWHPWGPCIFAARQADGHHSRSATSCAREGSLPHAIRIATWGPMKGTTQGH